MCRYYDKESAGRLEFSEFRQMVGDIRRCKGQSVSREELVTVAEQSAKWVQCRRPPPV